MLKSRLVLLLSLGIPACSTHSKSSAKNDIATDSSPRSPANPSTPSASPITSAGTITATNAGDKTNLALTIDDAPCIGVEFAVYARASCLCDTTDKSWTKESFSVDAAGKFTHTTKLFHDQDCKNPLSQTTSTGLFKVENGGKPTADSAAHCTAPQTGALDVAFVDQVMQSITYFTAADLQAAQKSAAVDKEWVTSECDFNKIILNVPYDLTKCVYNTPTSTSSKMATLGAYRAFDASGGPLCSDPNYTIPADRLSWTSLSTKN